MRDTLNDVTPLTLKEALAHLESHQAYVQLTAEAGAAKSLDELLSVISEFVPKVLGVPRASITMMLPLTIQVVALGGKRDGIEMARNCLWLAQQLKSRWTRRSPLQRVIDIGEFGIGKSWLTNTASVSLSSHH